MSAVERRRPAEPHWKIRPSRNQDFRRHQSLVSQPRPSLSRSTWLPDGPRSAHHALHREPVYVSFVSKAILWDRGLCHKAVRHHHPPHRPLLCPRFLSHMKARPEDSKPPRFLSSKSKLQPPFQGRTLPTQTLTAPMTQTVEGNFKSPGRGRNAVQTHVTGRHSAIAVPCLPLHRSPPSSTINPTLPHQNTHPHVQSNLNEFPASPTSPYPTQEEEEGPIPNEFPASPTSPYPTQEEEEEGPEDRRKVPQPALVSITKSDSELGPSDMGHSLSPASVVSDRSLSDFSRPHSSLFSRSTNLASGQSSTLSADIRDSDPEGSVCLSPFHPHSARQSPLALEESYCHQSSVNTTNTPPPYEPPSNPVKPLSSSLGSAAVPKVYKTSSKCGSTKKMESHHQAASADLALNPDSDSNPGLVTLAFPSTTWSSCPSPQKTTASPRSGSGPKLTPSPSMTRLESQRWPVLPPITPVRGRCGTSASRYSELSCTQSHAFDELEAIAPLSTSCPSMDEPFDSSCCPSPDTELSPGLAALTVACDSGNLGSISRVQLLLLNRNEPETVLSPFPYEEELFQDEDWSNEEMQDDPELTSAGVSRPLTAGSSSERCDSAGEVQENKSDQSEGGSGSPSSWIIDPSPSYNMFKSADPPGCSADDGDHTEEFSDYPRWGDRIESLAGEKRPEHSPEEMEKKMEERKTKALDILSKLQNGSPHQARSSKGRSNFEDFDFLAKYCIFSQEKLAEYKRAFEAEDGDGDGYISCLQVLLALKNIVPAELLSEDEEIYVYRILEMVDFRVTDGLVDLRLFAVIASLAQKIASMDEFMRSLISDMDFRSLEVRLFKAKEQREGSTAQPGFISAEQLLLEMKAGGIQLEHDAAIRLELQHIPPLDLLDFLAHLPLFMLIHKSVISNPLESSSNL